jgi:Major tropism determinant N-terminal domain
MTMPAPSSISGALRRIRLRRAWTEDWERVNPILDDGEPGYDKTQNMLKIGDGYTPWTALKYLTPPDTGIVVTGDVAIDSVMASHVNDETPHPVYDDGPSLVLLYQNAKV